MLFNFSLLNKSKKEKEKTSRLLAFTRTLTITTTVEPASFRYPTHSLTKHHLFLELDTIPDGLERSEHIHSLSHTRSAYNFSTFPHKHTGKNKEQK